MHESEVEDRRFPTLGESEDDDNADAGGALGVAVVDNDNDGCDDGEDLTFFLMDVTFSNGEFSLFTRLEYAVRSA